MATPNQIRRDAESALSDVQRLRREILEFSELQRVQTGLMEIQSPVADELIEFRDRAAELISRIEEMLQSLHLEPKKIRSPEEIFPLTALAQELKAQLEWLENILAHLEGMAISPLQTWPSGLVPSISSSITTALAKIRSYLVPLLKKFLSKLWSIISGLLTPKEWKLKGQVGTGLLGLANVEVEVTFGP